MQDNYKPVNWMTHLQRGIGGNNPPHILYCTYLMEEKSGRYLKVVMKGQMQNEEEEPYKGMVRVQSLAGKLNVVP